MKLPAPSLRDMAFAVLVAAVSLLPVAAQEPAVERPARVFRAGVDFVRVDAYPRRNGHIVQGLAATDFTLLEDGKPQTIDTFEFVRHHADPSYERTDPRNRAEADRWVAEPARRVFIIYVDLYHISRARSHQIRGPLMQVLAESMSPTDVVGVMTPETPLGNLAFVQRPTTIAAELERNWESGLADAPVQPRTPAEVELAACGDGNGFDKILERFRQDVFFTSLESLIAHVGARRQDRTNVILLSEGWQNRSGGIDIRDLNNLPSRGRLPVGLQIAGPAGPGRSGIDQFGRPAADTTTPSPRSCTELLARLEVDYEDRFRQLFRTANSHNVTFHTIDVGGVQTGAAMAELTTKEFLAGKRSPMGHPGVLQELAANTDGVSTINANDITAGLQQVFDRTAAYYLLSYASTNAAADGRYRRIEVRTRMRGVDVTARRGYTAISSEAQRLSATRAARATVPPMVAAAIGGLSRWDAGEELLGSATATGDAIHVVAELAPRERAGGLWREGAQVWVELTSDDGRRLQTTGHIASGAAAVEFDVPIGDGPADGWRVTLRAVTADREVTSRIEVASVPTARLGPVRLFRIPSVGRAVPQVVALPFFRKGERLRLEWRQVQGRAEPSVRLLDRLGQLLSPGAALASAFDVERGTLSVELHVSTLAEGDYGLEVATVGEDGSADRNIVAFRVVR